LELASLERIYDTYAKVYDRIFGRVFDGPRRIAVQWLDARPGERVIEVGVGTGIALPMYAPQAFVVGVDFSMGMLREAQDCIRAHELDNACILRMDALRLAFPDSSFDGVMAAYVITAVPDHRQLMAEIVRVSRPGARIVFVSHLRHRNPVVAFGQRLLCPLTRRLGWRTDLSLDDVLGGTSLEVVRRAAVAPFGMWSLVECRNTKTA
jgi:phosphatidylethanolamine/phosphatidyl-N-methylethanolamine N-methyltransferase